MSNQDIAPNNQSHTEVDSTDNKAELYIWRMANFTLASILGVALWGLPALFVSAVIASVLTTIFIAKLIRS